MTSLRIMFAMIFLSWTMINQFIAADDIQDLYFIINGYYNNFDQDKVEGGRHDQIELRLKPVKVPQLQKKYVTYYEEAINGVVYRMYVLAFAKVPNSPVIVGTYYNFTNPRKYKPGSFNTDELIKLRREDFDNSEGCQTSLELLSTGIFTGNAMDCRHAITGKHPMYASTLTCDGILFEPPMVSKEITSLLSYYNKRKGPRYPWTGLPKGYVGPCKKKIEMNPFTAFPVFT